MRPAPDDACARRDLDHVVEVFLVFHVLLHLAPDEMITGRMHWWSSLR